MQNILFFRDRRGKEPLKIFIEKQDKRVMVAIFNRLERVKRENLGDCKSIKGEESLYELRFSAGAGTRVYFGKNKSGDIILLCGEKKGTQKRDIQKAIKFWEEYNG